MREKKKKKINRPILEEVIIGKNVKSLNEVPKEAYDKAKKLIIAEGIKEIPDDFLVCNQYIEEIKLPESLESNLVIGLLAILRKLKI